MITAEHTLRVGTHFENTGVGGQQRHCARFAPQRIQQLLASQMARGSMLQL